MSALYFKQKLGNSKIFHKFLQFLPGCFLLKLHPLEYLMIEPTNICNLSCLLCTQYLSKRPKGVMTAEIFNKILPLLPDSIKEIQLHLAGESLLNKDLPLIIQSLKNRGFKKVALSSNGTSSFDSYEKIIKAGLDELVISLDGATKEIYDKYQRGGDFEKVLENTKKISNISDRKTRIVIQFVVMKHNESQIGIIKNLSEELGVDELWLKSASLNISSSDILKQDIIENAGRFLPKNQKFSRYVFNNEKIEVKDKPLICPWVFRTAILWNGDVSVCCADFDGQALVGNILEEGSFKKIWRSKRYHEFRKKVLKRDLNICRNCNVGDNPVVEVIKFSKKK